MCECNELVGAFVCGFAADVAFGVLPYGEVILVDGRVFLVLGQIADDDAAEAVSVNDLEESEGFFRALVDGHFDVDRAADFEFVQGGQKRLQALRCGKGLPAEGVRTADVELIVRVLEARFFKEPETGQDFGNLLLVAVKVLVGARDADARRDVELHLFEILDDGGRTESFKTLVDQEPAGFLKAPEARLGIAAVGLEGDGADGMEAEAHRREDLRELAVVVKARCQPEGVGESDAVNGLHECRVVKAEGRVGELPEERGSAHELPGGSKAIVDILRVKFEEEWFEDEAVEAAEYGECHRLEEKRRVPLEFARIDEHENEEG